MSMPFKFNFSANDKTRNKIQECNEVAESRKRIGKEILMNDAHFSVTERYCQQKKYNTLKCSSEIEPETLLHYIPAALTASELNVNTTYQDHNIFEKINDKSTDLIAGEYEGGFKIWESSNDLITYLSERKNMFAKGTKILELGCGAGLPGIYCLKQGVTVHFQDYNEEVINMSTIPNVILNAKFNSQIKMDSCRFYSGDWNLIEMLFHKCPDYKYDYILASETIYNPRNYEAFYSLIKATLKTTGKAYVAAKVCYFGVGGSTELFKSYVISKGYFDITVCKTFEEGIKREIFQMSIS